jgi:hypothetical protein
MGTRVPDAELVRSTKPGRMGETMARIEPTGSYVRRHPLPAEAASPSFRGTAAAEEGAVWSLLKTPNTIESLRRSLREELGRDIDPGVIHAIVAAFVQKDWAELSPDT